jgi:hypothetical protein
MSTFENNSRGGGTYDITIAAERDDGVFLGITIDDTDFNTVIDAVTTDPAEIEQFFREVEAAKQEYARLVAES